MAKRAKKPAPTVAAPAAAVVLPPLGTPLDGPGAPLRITALLGSGTALPYGPLALDALLAWAVAAREGFMAPVDGYREIEIPVAREPGGRFHLASFSCGEVVAHEASWVNRRFPVPEAQALAEPGFRRIQINAGAQKSYRIPLELQHFRDQRLTWFALGDGDRIADLLSLVTHIGKRRGVGHGWVREWRVEPCEPWPGFPVLRDGQPMRPLPLDWPGLAEDAERRYCRATYPYWRRVDEVACAVPGGMR